MSFVAVLCIALTLLVGSNAASVQHSFLEANHRAVVAAVEQGLQELLEGSHANNSPERWRSGKIEVSIATTFQALPKNALGRLAPRSVRYLVHNYFAREHGWQIKGLEPQGMRTDASEVHDVHILQVKAPALVEALLESKQTNRGLSLEDTATMIALLERFILDESVAIVQSSYWLNRMSAADHVDEVSLHEILRSYLLLFETGLRSNLTDIGQHLELKERIAQLGVGWSNLVEFESDAVVDYNYRTKDVRNPFRQHIYSPLDTAQIVDSLAQDFGRWQNAECNAMKDELMGMDADGSGLIPLSKFYSRSAPGGYQFTESLEYLRTIGAIDDTHSKDPRVRLANYITGPSNCIASSNYYSVCCLNECESMMNELEASIKSPVASPERILMLVQNMTSSSMMSPREVPADLTWKLNGIAEHHRGEVPLHGRLFAQWLHLAFPHECPYPHISAEGSELTAHRWLGGKAIASDDERRDHVELIHKSSELEQEYQPSKFEWSEEEVLPLLEVSQPQYSTGDITRMVVQGAMFLVVLRFVLAGCGAAASMGTRVEPKKGQRIEDLPL